MILYLMTCGHIAQGTISETGLPICVIHGCNTVAWVIDTEKNPKAHLEGRRCHCTDCGNVVDSDWTLPFFQHRPDCEQDTFYDGCYGWD